MMNTVTQIAQRSAEEDLLPAVVCDADGQSLTSPTGPWAMAQGWRHLLFAHWPLPPDALAAHVPAGLALDTYDGWAWLGITPFLLRPFRLRGLPPLPGIAAFHEINVRTYVAYRGQPGVLFLSLDADNLLAVVGARMGYHLPYYNSQAKQRIRGDTATFVSRREPCGAFADFRAAYRPVSPPFLPAPGTLAHWLSMRFRLFAADRQGRLWRSEIRHQPWPLQEAEARIARNTMALAHGILLPELGPLLHYSRGVLTHIWPPEPLY